MVLIWNDYSTRILTAEDIREGAGRLRRASRSSRGRKSAGNFPRRSMGRKLSPIPRSTRPPKGNDRMLADKDRIFKQSLWPARLGPQGRAGARGLGWHQGVPGKRARRDHRRGEGFRPARARRRRIPDRHEMVVHAQEVGRAAALPCGQCRRVRAGHLQGPRDHAARSASADRGLPDRLLRHGRQHGYIYIRGEFIRERERLQAAIDEAYDGQADRQGQRPRLGFRSLSCTTAPALTSAAKKPRCSKASKARRASRG